MRTGISRKLRKNQTPHESKLWYNLRNRFLGNLKFRRQYKIGKFVVDFYCPAKKLVIELDGGHHAKIESIIKDRQRQRWIEAQGYKVLRFENSEIDENLDGVLEKIMEFCGLLDQDKF